jgi:hypothetical protein
MQKNNLVFITFDSCRYDTFAAAKTPNIDRLGTTELRHSFASWTVPAHTVYLMGISPHKNPAKVNASEVYRKDFVRWSERLNIPDISFKSFLPQLSLPAFLRKNGYKTGARVSMPVLNQTTNINNHFDSYKLMDSHYDFEAIIDSLEFSLEQPSFYILNVGETHYPYIVKGESADHLPRLHGVHGVFKHLDDKIATGSATAEEEYSFTEESLKVLKDKQQTNVEYLDKLFEKLYAKCPPNTYFIVTGDHGECFGEEGFFGHGPIIHPKVFEVPYVEGMLK